jgi:hypothetical protein
MKSFVQPLLFASIVALLLVLPQSPAAAQDDYWTSHWNWYDNVYSPYYYRTYSYGPGYSTYYGPGYGYYGPTYYSRSYGPSYYSAPYGAYYGTPAVGVYPGVGAARVGPLRFGWR